MAYLLIIWTLIDAEAIPSGQVTAYSSYATQALCESAIKTSTLQCITAKPQQCIPALPEITAWLTRVK